MTTSEAISHYGSIRALAVALDVWPHTIYKWGDKPPELQQYRIERLTNGALKADDTTKRNA